jgi:hypothetical protein
MSQTSALVYVIEPDTDNADIRQAEPKPDAIISKSSNAGLTQPPAPSGKPFTR